jgi:excisionase family DNA binding protein
MQSAEGNTPRPSRTALERPSLEGLGSILTTDSVARVLRVNRKTVYEMVRAGSIPGVVRLGRVIRFSRDALLAWLGVKKGESRGGQ